MKFLFVFIFLSCALGTEAQIAQTQTVIHDTSEQKNSIRSNSESIETKNSAPAITQPPTISGKAATIKEFSPMTSYEFGLSLGILIFGLLLMLFEAYMVKTKKISNELLVKFILVTLIITSTLFLITAGYSNDQIAPAIGLFGTVVGYILGKNANKNEKNEKDVT